MLLEQAGLLARHLAELEQTCPGQVVTIWVTALSFIH